MKGRPYPTYKPSNADWMGEVPTHWDVDRLKWTVDSSRNGVWGDEPDGGPEDIACIRVADFDRANQSVIVEEPTIRKIRMTDQEGRVLQKGDLLLEKSGGGEGWPVGFVVEYTHDLPAVCSNFIARMKPSAKVRSRYLRYLHHALYAARVNVRSIKQTSGIQNLDAGSYFDELAPFPPLPEQDAIGIFLDRETVKIDTLIAEQRTLIERLREKRQAAISTIVTKGLDPATARKPSADPGIGDVPVHWDVKPLKHVVPGITVGIVINPSSYYVEEGVPALRSLNVSTGKVEMDNLVFISPESNESQSKSKIFNGDIVVVRTGKTGTAAIVPKDLDGANCIDLLIVRRSEIVQPEYLHYVLNSDCANAQIERLSCGAIQAHFNTGTLANLLVPVPPPKEQAVLIAYLDRETAAIDKLVAEAETSIALLQEHRSALITAVVTGKVDVRGECHGD